MEQLLDIAKLEHGGPVTFTEEQEQFLVDHPRHMALYGLLLLGCRWEDLEQESGLSPSVLKVQLRDLERAGFLEAPESAAEERSAINRLLRGPFQWRRGGPLERTYAARIARTIFEKTMATVEGQMTCEQEGVFYMPFDMTVKPETAVDFVKELKQVLQKYCAYSPIQIAIEPRKSLKQHYGIVAFKQFNLWDDILANRS